MTAEPRDVEEISADLDALAEPSESRLHVQAKQHAAKLRLLRDVAPLLARLAAADRENAELRGEVERLRSLPFWAGRWVEMDLAAQWKSERNEASAQLAAAQAQLAEAVRVHRDLTRRLGFGDNVTEPQADNDEIVAWYEEQCDEAAEWRESQSWRSDCAQAGHPDDQDCHEHDPSLRLEAAEARLEAVRAALVHTGYFTEDEIGPDLAPRIVELLAALSAAPQPERDVCGERHPSRQFRCSERGPHSEHVARGPFKESIATWPEPPASDEPARCLHGNAAAQTYACGCEPARQSPEPDSRRWGGSMRHMPDPYRADHNCVPEGCSECRQECRHCGGSGNARTFDGDGLGICGTCHGTGSAAGGGL